LVTQKHSEKTKWKEDAKKSAMQEDASGRKKGLKTNSKAGTKTTDTKTAKRTDNPRSPTHNKHHGELVENNVDFSDLFENETTFRYYLGI
jgi:hypothetical protein